jgi:anti-anti-sigma factor
MSTHISGSIPIIVIEGDITCQHISKICAEMVKYIQKNVPAVGIDLSRTAFIDSQGLGIFIYCSELYKKASKKIFLISPQTFIKNTMIDLSFDLIFTIVDSENQIFLK